MSKIKTFKQFLTERELVMTEMRVEIMSLEGKKHAAALKKKNVTAEHDDEGFVVTVQSPQEKRRVREYMLQNGWDRVDIADAYPELKG